MGFKKTTEGRVFFHNLDDTANDSAPAAPARTGEQTQLQILTLLKALNERLKMTQTERDTVRRELENYRSLVEDLAGRTEQAEQAFQNTQNRAVNAEKLAADTLRELAGTRKLLFEIEERAQRADQGVSSLKMLQDEQAERVGSALTSYAQLVKRLKDAETKQDDLGRKIEERDAGQERLIRRIDQVAEERARFVRKIERIEETLIQTRESLNARAMVLLTDQGLTQAAIENNGPRMISPSRGGIPSWRRSLQFGAAAAALFLVSGGLAFWIAGAMQQPQNSATLQPEVTASLEGQNRIPETPAITPGVSAPVEQTHEKWSVQSDTGAFSPALQTPVQPPSPAQAAPDVSVADDIGTLDLTDDRKLLQLLEENPDVLAAKLNEIEPEAVPAAPENGIQAAQPVPLPEKQKPAQTGDAQAPSGFTNPDPALPEALKSLEARAFEGSPEAEHDLAAVYAAGHAGARQDYQRAVYWFRKAADQGIANAAYNLGVLYHQGLGVQFDIEDAIGWYKKAAEKGHAEAQYNLGIAYIEGIGVPYDPAKAALYFETAAGGGVMEAAYNLGLIYENGLLGAPAPQDALKWYKMAADKGSPEARAALEQLSGAMKGTPSSGKKTTQKPGAGDRQESALHGNLEQMVVAQVQEYLMHIGLYSGPADGVAGPQTNDAIRSYQVQSGLPADGRASQALLAHMVGQAGENPGF